MHPLRIAQDRGAAGLALEIRLRFRVPSTASRVWGQTTRQQSGQASNRSLRKTRRLLS
jgi:hypothetical protein